MKQCFFNIMLGFLINSLSGTGYNRSLAVMPGFSVRNTSTPPYHRSI